MAVSRAETRVPASMREAVGYDEISGHERSVESALVLKQDRLFLLLNAAGEIAPTAGSLGLFHDDTRILSRYELRFTGGPPVVLSSQVPDVFHAQIDLAVNDRAFGGDVWDPKNVVHIRREILLEDRMIERLTLTNYLTTPVDYVVELLLGCDFADIFEVRGWAREGRGQFFRPEPAERSLGFAYRGTDGRLLLSEVAFKDPVPAIEPGRVRWEFALEPNQRYGLEWSIAAADEAASVAPEDGAVVGAAVKPGDSRAADGLEGAADAASVAAPAELAASADEPVGTGAEPGAGRGIDERHEGLRRVYAAWRRDCTRWKTDVAEFSAALRHAVDDLRALYIQSDGEPIISAGIPWYSTAFGRDSIITSLQTLPLNPMMAVDTLRYLARHQGEREAPFTEEQPGRIMHELRRGEMARSGEIPHIPYYGTVDATPLWLVLLHESWRWLGDAELVGELMPHALRALEWIERYGDLDGDGFVEYARASEKGLANQGWKDSSDGVPFPDGRLPQGPIALVEVQGYVYDAKVRMAALLEAFGDADRAAGLRSAAARLRDAIIDHFWLEEEGTFALALDGEKRPLPTVTTNAGHLLWSRVPSAEQAARMADGLLGPQMFSGWGMRTLSSAHPVFNPMSYHNGSIWPHDNALVVLGLALYGHARRAMAVLDALHDAAANMRFHRLPELFCGMSRAQGARPVLYPVSCSPQAWASGAFFMLLQAATGILPDAPAGVLHIREPQLPSFLHELKLTGLRIGGSRVAIEFRRHGTRTLANLLRVEGEPLQVRIEIS